MRHLVAAVLSTLLPTVALAQASPELYQLGVKDIPVENGKTLEMTFRELERQGDSSTVEIDFVSGGSVSSSMFALRGMCGVSRARGEQYFRATQVSRKLPIFRMTFPKTVTEADLRPAHGADKVFTRDECALLGF
jgi:hypothetical protein